MAKKNVVVVKDKENPEPTEVIASAIIGVSVAVEKMNKSPLTQEAIILLIHDALPYGRSGKICSKAAIREVLDTAAELKTIYIKKVKKNG